MFMKLTKHRSFDYTPRMYKPEGEEIERPKIQFSHLRGRKKSRSFAWLILMTGLIIFMMYVLSQVANNF